MTEQATTCLYCGEHGLVLALKYRDDTDLHTHKCGTNLLIARSTGEVLETRRHYWCERYDTLQAEMRVLSQQVYDLIHQRDGGSDDEQLPF